MDNIFSKFSANLRQALLISEKIANEQKSKIDTDHQLLALIVQKGSLANDILNMFDISMERAQLVASLVVKEHSHNGVNQSAKESIKLAVQYAMKYKHDSVDCEHLLLALISNKSWNSYNIIERMGVNPKEIKKQIDSIFNQASKQATPEFINLNQGMDIDQDELEEPNAFGPFPGMPGANARTKKGKSAIKDFTINISELAAKGKIDPVIGRSKEIERIIQILIRRKKNNPVLIGEPGVGKTAIIEGLALKIHRSEVPPIIANKTIYSLDLSALLAGTMYRGQFEIRIKKLLEEIEKDKNSILFIDELHTVIGAGSAEGSLDAANILKPKLARGEIRIIGATTLDEYKKHIEKDSAFERRFQTVIVSEPSLEESISILRGVAKEYESHHHVTYEPTALVAAASLADRYIQDRFLPDKAIDLIDEAAAAQKIKATGTNELVALHKELKATIDKKDAAVADEHYEKATFLRQKEISIKSKIAKEEGKHSKSNRAIITSQDIAAIVAKWTGIPVTNLDIAGKKKYLELEKALRKSIIGQDEAIAAIASSIRRARVAISNPNRPMGTFIFLGPTGVGKTELVKVLTKEIFGTDKSLVKIDMSEFMEKHNVSRLVGSPAGYVGYEEGGQLTEVIRRQPYSVVLFDEIEKAHPDVFNILLQIMEDGELTDAKGRKVNFRNTLIIMTSNLGTNLLNSHQLIGFSGDSDDEGNTEYQEMVDKVKDTITKSFPPEFLNRIDQTIIFHSLAEKDIIKIAKLELHKLHDRIKKQKIDMEIDKAVVEWVAKKGFSKDYGARPMRKVISENIENQLAEQILAGKIEPGNAILLKLDNDRIIVANKSTQDNNERNKG